MPKRRYSMAVKMAVKHVTLRAWSDNSDVAPVKINQGDILSRTIIMTLLDSTGAPIDLTLSSARVHFSKPDGTVVYLTASIVNATAGIISVTLDSQCTAVPGLVKSIVQVTGPDGENLFFAGLTFVVGAINIEGSIISSNEFTALTDALKQVQGIANKVDKSTTINGHSLEESFSLTSSDIGAIDNALKGAANGIATLNSNGKVIQDPASYGRANGGATLNSNGKVIQDPASYGQPNGGATLNAQGKVIQDPATAYLPLPETDDKSTDQHWIKFADGTLIHWGYTGGHHSDINTAYGNAFWRQDFEYRLPTAAGAFVGNRYAHVTITSSGLATAVNEVIKADGITLQFDLLSPASVTYLEFGITYLVVGRWK
jgi:hypothetical protein